MRFSIVLLLIVLASQAGVGQPLTPAQQKTILNGAQGKEFWIAIPPNEIPPYSQNSLEVYIASPFDTDVYVLDPLFGTEKKYPVTANHVRTLNDRNGETNWLWEIREYEQVVNKGIRLRADKPFTVSVLNSKIVTSDGYLALPTSQWDTEYIVTTYYDFKEFKPWAGGFTIVAAEDDTRVRIQLRGAGGDDATTSTGRRLGSSPFDITLGAGDVYHVAGDGQTRGVFDLTGTQVTSNKPIGLISSHQRTTMPNMLINGNGRDHLVEMNAPVSAWRTEYVTVELQRESRNPSGKGDVFRVVAAERNTKWLLQYFDKQSGELLGQGGGVIDKAGGFHDISQSTGPAILTHGVSVWTADKPIQVVQYATSASFDGDQYHDPFMVNLTPSDRFVSASIFQVPTDTKYTDHKLNLIIKADPTDPEYIENLKSLEIDGVPVWDHPRAVAPKLLNTMIMDSLHWAQIEFGTEATAHVILGNGKVTFGGYLYGFGAVDSYGWPLGPLHDNVVASDTAKPIIGLSPSADGVVDVVVTEKTNDPETVREEPFREDQVDAGIALVELINAQNLELRAVQPPGMHREDAAEARYQIVPVDASKGGTATMYALDYAGNITYEEIVYTEPKYPQVAAPSQVDLGETGIDTAVCTSGQLVIHNTGTDTAWVTEMTVSPEESGFSIDADACPLPIQIAPADSVSLSCVCFVSSASGSFSATLQMTANDQEEPRTISLAARVRENVQVSVQEDPEAANGLDVRTTSAGDVRFVNGPWQPARWTLFSVSGEVVMSGAVAAGNDIRLFSTHGLSRGLYVLRLDGDAQTSSHKLLVD